MEYNSQWRLADLGNFPWKWWLIEFSKFRPKQIHIKLKLIKNIKWLNIWLASLSVDSKLRKLKGYNAKRWT